jgi:N6-L-threonylcarbamoyladenine synthase
MTEQSSRILAIETSCDETSAAVVENGQNILSNVIASQTNLHAQYGGVFPEVASRKHVEVIYAVIDKAMRQAYLGYDDLDAIAVTRGPGLVGSLLVGANVAKGIAVARNKPLLAMNHLEGHIYSLWLTGAVDQIEFPIMNLIVSGGHSELILMTDHLTYEYLGGTLDDAAGEAFDKVGRLLDLPYPGGPAIDQAARHGEPRRFKFPRAVMRDGYDFSFSGLKTAVMRSVKSYHPDMIPVNDIAASFQMALVDALATKAYRAAEEYNVRAMHVVGGVSANSMLREVMSDRFGVVPVRFPPPVLCTDNAAMIGAVAHQYFIRGQRDNLDFDVIPNLQLI